MRSRSLSAALVAILCGGCVTGRELRVHAERGAPIVPQHAAREAEPQAGYMLVNPAVCLHLGEGAGGSDGTGAMVLLAAMVGCAGFLTAVDLVALPIQAVRHQKQRRDLEEIGIVCPLDDPAVRVAPELAARMVQEFGFAPAPPSTPPTMMADGDPSAGAGAVQLRVTTRRFDRASRISWEGRIEFVGPDGERLWDWSCAGKAPERAAETFEAECEAARGEITALANQCVESVTVRLRELWPGWAESALAVSVEDDPLAGR